ncbi:hypothetical protein CPB84DRAFT_1771294 [Gymnopilus junonius]|uniref:EKC/KEOPS complex subunit CGI121 n=1 Tax=Gymnopilus junonius TaxID=109634 RepID=A0A9P5NVS9_GYMJU|nr:hypothetical protein CPB84DRAFT_1771294 [Gymnopilus junonius]
MAGAVQGDIVPLSELERVTDWASIKKYHKLNSEVAIKEVVNDPIREKAIVDNIVVTSVAMKSVMQ